MRYECNRSDTGTKWFEINLISVGSDLFSVAASYGIKGPSDEDMVIEDLYSIDVGPYLDMIELLSEKITERESIGYTKIEPKQDK